jgi:hypothetical protein
VPVEKIEHIRHTAPDYFAVIQAGQGSVLHLEVQPLELVGQLL